MHESIPAAATYPHACKARIAILTALFPEAAAIARRLRLPLRLGERCQMAGDLALAIVGLRARLAREILDEIRPQVIVLAGLAGALAPHLQIGQIILDAPEGLPPPPAPAPPVPLRLAIPAAPTFHRGKICTSDHLLASPQAKAQLFATGGALAVDMETEPVRVLAQNRGIAFIALRAISDTAADSLDPALLTLIDDLGRPRPFKAAAHLLAHPAKLPAMLTLAKNSRCALSQLAFAVDALIASNWPTAIPHASRSIP